MQNPPTTKTRTDPRQKTLIHLLLNNPKNTPVKTLAIQAGYSESYANGMLYYQMGQPAFKKKILQYARGREVANIPKLLKITDEALTAYSQDARLAIEKPALLKQLRQDVELSKPEEIARAPNINIGSLTVVRSGLRNYIEDDVQEAEVLP
jgi:hypothetical protein